MEQMRPPILELLLRLHLQLAVSDYPSEQIKLPKYSSELSQPITRWNASFPGTLAFPALWFKSTQGLKESKIWEFFRPRFHAPLLSLFVSSATLSPLFPERNEAFLPSSPTESWIREAEPTTSDCPPRRDLAPRVNEKIHTDSTN